MSFTALAPERADGEDGRYRRSAASPSPSAAPARAHPAVVLALIATGGLAAIGLWWYGTPAVHGFGDWLTNAGRVTGLLAGYGVVVLIALMARLPPLERGIGADRLRAGMPWAVATPSASSSPMRCSLPGATR